MTNYEYRAHMAGDSDAVERWANLWGHDGWQLFGVYPSKLGFLVVMQREAPAVYAHTVGS